MAKDCLYHAKKGDVPVVDGHIINYLRKQTLRGIMAGETFYDEDYNKFIAINGDTKGNPYISAAGIDHEKRKVAKFDFAKSHKFLRVRGVRCFTEDEVTAVASFEIRSGNHGFEVYRLDKTADGEKKCHINDCQTRKEAEEFCRTYRMRKFLEVA